MMKSDAEAAAQLFIQEHPIEPDVREDCPEFAAALDEMVAEAAEHVRHGEDPDLADKQLWVKVFAWVQTYKAERLAQGKTGGNHEGTTH